jgi:LEA14-like dessication related protein
MNTRTILTIGGIAAVLWWLLRKGRTLQSLGQQLSVRLITVKFKRLTLFNVEVSLFMDIINPTAQAINIDSVSADIRLDGSNFGKVNLLQPFTIPANGTQRIELPILISNTSIIPNLVNIAQNLSNLKAEINGSINVRNLGPVPFNQTISVSN